MIQKGSVTTALSALGNAAVPQPVIAATGLYVPPNSISNAELVGAFNAAVELAAPDPVAEENESEVTA